MKITANTPKSDGFYMPAEYSEHDGTLMIFPDRPGSWRNDALPAALVFTEIIEQIAKDESVYVLCNSRVRKRAEQYISKIPNVFLLDIPQDDAWARDTGPTFVRNQQGIVRGIDWKFNAWGGDFDGLYSDYVNDNRVASIFCEHLHTDCYDAQHFVLEGGSIHTDGEGTILVTETCLLSQGRNPQMTKEQISDMLCQYLGGEKVIWLPCGIYNDETNEHVDNVCSFISPAEVVLAWTDNVDDPQYLMSKACYDFLMEQSDANGRKFVVHKLPIPDVPICFTADDIAGMTFAVGEDTREIGECLAASYVNFYFTNHSVLLPQFGGENRISDERALNIMRKLCPNRTVVPIPAIELIKGGGNIHCLTQQIPKGAILCEK